MPQEFELTLSALPTAVRQMRNAAADFAQAVGLSEEAVYDVRLAVSEAVTNSVRHGSSAGGEVVMRLVADTGALEITISDQGPDDDSEHSPGLGLGLPIMEAVAGNLRVAQAATGTVVTMTFNLTQP